LNTYGTVGVKEESLQPSNFVLYQNYPNPFNPETKIRYSVIGPQGLLRSSQHVSLKIYDVLGREVATLVDEVKEAGVHNSEFRIYGELRRTIPHSELSSGVYFYQLRAGSYVETKKMLLLR